MDKRPRGLQTYQGSNSGEKLLTCNRGGKSFPERSRLRITPRTDHVQAGSPGTSDGHPAARTSLPGAQGRKGGAPDEAGEIGDVMWGRHRRSEAGGEAPSVPCTEQTVPRHLQGKAFPRDISRAFVQERSHFQGQKGHKSHVRELVGLILGLSACLREGSEGCWGSRWCGVSALPQNTCGSDKE